MSGRLSTTPVAISSLRERSCSPEASVTSKRPSGLALGGRHLDVAELHRVVARQLLPGERQELRRRHAVAGEIAVQRMRGVVARAAGVAHEHGPAAAAEDQRRAQSGGPGADDDDVEHSTPAGSARCATREARESRIVLSDFEVGIAADAGGGQRRAAARRPARASRRRGRASPRQRVQAGDVVAGERDRRRPWRRGRRTSCSARSKWRAASVGPPLPVIGGADLDVELDRACDP